jgi:hypothetical protein
MNRYCNIDSYRFVDDHMLQVASNSGIEKSGQKKQDDTSIEAFGNGRENFPCMIGWDNDIHTVGTYN